MNSDKIPLMESFYTIQGEGANSGMPAYFIRLAGCDVGCHWCDVKESWDVKKHTVVSIESIVEEALKFNPANSVITGGEPLMYNLDGITQQLKKNGIKTFLETSGAYPLTGEWDWICLSPKKFKPALPEFYLNADELKIIIYNKHDFKFADACLKLFQGSNKNHKGRNLFLQPEWSRRKEILPAIIDFVKENPHWRISLQAHKFMNVP